MPRLILSLTLEKIQYKLLSYISLSDMLSGHIKSTMIRSPEYPKWNPKNGFTSNISRYLWRNLFHFWKLRWLVGFPFYSIYSIFKLISKKKLNLHIYLLIEFQLEGEFKFEIIFSPASNITRAILDVRIISHRTKILPLRSNGVVEWFEGYSTHNLWIICIILCIIYNDSYTIELIITRMI